MTEVEFVLPQGYELEGNVHRSGRMRRATGADEIHPLADPRVSKNPAYLVVILLARVVTKLGSLEGEQISTHIIENLYATDLAFLQALYNRVNSPEENEIACPQCHHRFRPEGDLAGG